MDKGVIAVIFVSKRRSEDEEGYGAAAQAMEEAARRFPGFRGIHSARGADGLGITVSYWADEAAAQAWKMDPDHAAVRAQGREAWYDSYEMIVAQVTRSYDWTRGEG